MRSPGHLKKEDSLFNVGKWSKNVTRAQRRWPAANSWHSADTVVSHCNRCWFQPVGTAAELLLSRQDIKKKVEEERHWAVLYSSNINLSLSLSVAAFRPIRNVHYRNKKCERILNRGSSDFCEWERVYIVRSDETFSEFPLWIRYSLFPQVCTRVWDPVRCGWGARQQVVSHRKVP